MRTPPRPENFGLTAELIATEEENRKIIKAGPHIWTGLGLTAICILTFFLWAFAAHTAIIVIVIALGLFFVGDKYAIQYEKIKNITINPAYDAYLKAKELWTISQNEYWTNINGREFEYRVADLLKKHGYSVILTPATNDGGVDIIIKEGSVKIAVQCKCHKNPIGPKDARELYGVMCSRDNGFTSGILICPSGFTKGVYEFVAGKPIRLIELRGLIQLAQNVR